MFGNQFPVFAEDEEEETTETNTYDYDCEEIEETEHNISTEDDLIDDTGSPEFSHETESALFVNKVLTKGDLDDDGDIDTLDYVILSNYLKGKHDFVGEEYIDACDINGDGLIDRRDSSELKDMVYYGQVDNKNVSVIPKEIHTVNQKKYLDSKYSSIASYSSGGHDALPVTIQYDSSIIGDAPEYEIKVSEHYDMSNSVIYRSSKRSANINNSKVKTLYYWTVSNENEISPVQSFYVESRAVRNLSTGTINNDRDIGGFVSEDGNYVVRQGMIYRGTQLNKTQQTSNYDFLKNDLGIVSELNVSENNNSVLDVRQYHYQMALGTDDFVKNHDQLIQVFDVLSDPDNYPIYLHCIYGTDRTGFICFLVNALCGVSREECYKDFLFSYFAGFPRQIERIESRYVNAILATDGRNLAEKTYNKLVSIGIEPEKLDKVIEIMREYRPSSKYTVSVPEPLSKSLKYDGSTKKLEFESDHLFNVYGGEAADVGTYTATISLKDPSTYTWNNGSKADISINWSISDQRVPVEKPLVDISSFIYSGEEYEIPVDEKEYYVVDGNKATDAGTYEMTIKLSDKEKYMWSDKTNDDIIYEWAIEKADIDISGIEFNSVIYTYDGETKEIVYSGELPEEIEGVEYTGNAIKGRPDMEMQSEATMKFILKDSNNYNELDDMTAIMTIEPLFTEYHISFEDDEITDIITIMPEKEYELPAGSKEGYEFVTWCALTDGKITEIAISGIWNYIFESQDVVLVPVYKTSDEVSTSIRHINGHVEIDINMNGNGVLKLIGSDIPFDESESEQQELISLYKMGTNLNLVFETDRQYFYLVSDSTKIYEFIEDDNEDTKNN